MISLSKVCKSYSTRNGRHAVLRGVDLEIGRGEKIGILGRNGAGKSTLVRLISGAELPDSGRIFRDMSVSWPLAFGGSFQGSLTGMDNIRFICRVYDADVGTVLPFVEDFSELGDFLFEPVKTYSAGMRARLAFSMSMAIEFDCFLIDEVISVGDTRFHEKCRHELFERRRDRAMIIVSHEVHNIRAHCDRACVLQDGVLHNFVDVDEAYAFYNGNSFAAKVMVSSPQQSVQRLEGIADLKVLALSTIEDIASDGGYVPPEAFWLIRQARAPAEVLRVVASLRSEGSLQALAYARRHPGLEFKLPSLLRVGWPNTGCCVIFVLSEAWLPYVLAVADEVYRRDGLQSVLVYDQWCPALADPEVLGPAVLFQMPLSELEVSPAEALFPATLVISHSFGWAPKTAVILQRFPDAKVGVYLDGFRSGLPGGTIGGRSVEISFSFGAPPVQGNSSSLVVVDPEAVIAWAERVGSLYRLDLETASPPPFALVHLRGWGNGPYPFDVDAVVGCLVDTIEQAAREVSLVVLRTDSLAPQNFMEQVQSVLSERGVRHISFADFMRDAGVSPALAALPFELLLVLEIVMAAHVHVLFDSPVGIALACAQRVKREMRLALGVVESVPAQEGPENSMLADAFRPVRDLAFRSLKVIQGMRPDVEVLERLPSSYVFLRLNPRIVGGYGADGYLGGIPS